MADNPNNDPFTRAYDAIQAALANHAPFAALVKPGNQASLRITAQKQLKPRNAGDWPEEMLKISSINADVFEASSRTVKFSAGYALQIASGVVTVEIVARVWWEAMRALYFSGPFLGINDIVQRWSAHRAGPVALKDYQGRDQWVALMNINVMFAMSQDTLRQYPPQSFNT